jgi:hypothetical protein
MADRFVFFVVTNFDIINDRLSESLDRRFLEFKEEFSTFDALVRVRWEETVAGVIESWLVAAITVLSLRALLHRLAFRAARAGVPNRNLDHHC